MRNEELQSPQKVLGAWLTLTCGEDTGHLHCGHIVCSFLIATPLTCSTF